MQTTSHLLMIRPVNFGFNGQTAVNNAFQVAGKDEQAQEKALAEFNGFVEKLLAKGVDVTVINDSPVPHTPDSIFPNNWVSFHEEGIVCLYPMYAPNRRLERKPEVLARIGKKFKISKTIDFSYYEQRELFLEGTGSMVLDRVKKLAYACLSARTDRKVLQVFCDQMGYKPVVFSALDQNDQPIYHTNVMMCVAEGFVLACTESITKKEEKSQFLNQVKQSGKELIEISFEQMNHFAGNMLQVQNADAEKILVMSSQAFESLTAKQIKKLEAYNSLLHSPLTVIETNGGGSARCMMAEVHLPLL